MLSKKMQDALNNQVQAEIASGYLYLAMAAYFESLTLKGAAKWMHLQAKEELGHGMKIFDFINERGGRVALKAIEAPQKEWKSPLDAFDTTYKHEQKVTGLINDLVDLATKENDHATFNFLQWFVEEQVEEEANASEIVDMLKMVADSKNGLFMLDRELGKRE